jgi:glyoxylase-like metal-dependent hydrolase (beta-lactamase superfamily II)
MTTVSRTLPYELAPNIHWLGGCIAGVLDGEEIHGSSHQYLIVGEHETLLVDPGSPSLWERMEEQLDSVLGDRPLDWIFPTHSEIPHAGNFAHLMAKYPAARVVGDVRDYHLFFPPYADRCVPKGEGEEIDLGGGYRFVFLPAILRDLENSQWGYERSQRVLFSSDGFQHLHAPPTEADSDLPLHRPGECLLTTDDILDATAEDIDRLAKLFRLTYFSLRFIDPEVATAQLDALLAKYPPDIIAPAHGFIITNPEPELEVFKKAHRVAMRGAHEPSYSSQLTR